MLRLHAGQPEVEFFIRLAVTESGPVSCPGKLHQPWNLQFSNFVVSRDFFHQFTRRILYPFGRDLRLRQTSGMVDTTTLVGRVWSSYSRRGRRLANSRPPAELQGTGDPCSLDMGERILEGYYISRGGWHVTI